MALFIIPLSPAPQDFDIDLGGTTYHLSVTWCAPAGTWMLNIASKLRDPLICGVALVAGSDFLAPYKYLGIPGKMFVKADYDAFASPSKDDLGTRSQLYYQTE